MGLVLFFCAGTERTGFNEFNVSDIGGILAGCFRLAGRSKALLDCGRGSCSSAEILCSGERALSTASSTCEECALRKVCYGDVTTVYLSFRATGIISVSSSSSSLVILEH